MKVYTVLYHSFPDSGYSIALFVNKADADKLSAECTAMAARFNEALYKDDDSWDKLYEETFLTIPHETCRNDGEFNVQEIEIEESYKTYIGRRKQKHGEE